jgi:hypothetical protein
MSDKSRNRLLTIHMKKLKNHIHNIMIFELITLN